ncbi:uncharacterized protein K460DRAFT_413034 [Cucurbitaria berberidis CBS 394.84]|uniref:Uncharacterized protein n=1 Tax=Cucurbitaria berberidis CBS 394.84 TaxID=1168544 RepID=A0A9P4GTG3_9PLEO|nr:uncharacterized protein K460DRAFT_413034 [Cucurbitaria berberidis CBS 394.84]KAF1851477.1 hypothetical protein K460DRAFT_413034 [Cucurbitaria berberidis CBS 394.84]
MSNFSKKELKLLYSSYGEDDLYNSGKFKPLTRNLTTGKILMRGHHCGQCNNKMTQNCYENLHYAYCSTWVTRNRDGRRVRVRCGERFALRSDGCAKHPRVQGYNEPLYRAADGYDVDLAEFDDTDPGDLKGEPEDNEDDFEAESEELERLVEAIIEKDGYLPPDFHAKYWQDRAKEKSFAVPKNSGAPGSGNHVAMETISEDQDEVKVTASRGQGNILTSGKAGRGMVNQKRGISLKERPLARDSQTGFTYAGNASVSQPEDGKQKIARSYAPKGSKPKAPMEVRRGPSERDEDATNDTGNHKGKKRVAKWYDKMTGKKEKDESS